VVYVLHAFQKKSPKGITSAWSSDGLKVAQQDYEARYDKAKR
jgi:phage-related protein